MDTIVSKDDKTTILTLVERSTIFLKMFYLDKNKAECINTQLEKILSEIIIVNYPSITTYNES